MQIASGRLKNQVQINTHQPTLFVQVDISELDSHSSNASFPSSIRPSRARVRVIVRDLSISSGVDSRMTLFRSVATTVVGE
jgi:hypothetical protein